MKVTMTNARAYQCLNLMAGLKETGKLGFAIAKNRRKLESELREYIIKRDGLVRKYGTQKENDNYFIPQEKLSDFLKELTEFDTMEFDIEIQQVDEDTFCGGHLNSNDMFLLDWMIREED